MHHMEIHGFHVEMIYKWCIRLLEGQKNMGLVPGTWQIAPPNLWPILGTMNRGFMCSLRQTHMKIAKYCIYTYIIYNIYYILYIKLRYCQ